MLNRLILCAVLLLGLSTYIHQAEALTLSPVRIEVSGNPGETITREILIKNESDSITTYYSSYANFESQGETGSPSFVQAQDDLGTWMYTQESVVLKANESRVIPMTITIPANAAPGGHFAALFWGTSPNDSKGVTIGARTGTLFLLSVNGDVKEDAGLLGFGTKDNKKFYTSLPVTYTYRFKNDGGDRIKPVGKITMHDLFYIPEDKIDANPSAGNILPNSTRKFNVDWVKNPRAKEYSAPTGAIAGFFDQALYQWNNYAFGPYFVKLNLLYGTEATRVTKYTFIFVFPWQLLLCLLIIFTILFWGGKKAIKRYNRHIIQKARAGMNTPTDATHV